MQKSIHLDGTNAGQWKGKLFFINDTLYFQDESGNEEHVTVSGEKMKNYLHSLDYGKNLFFSYDTIHSPFEADRNKYMGLRIWRNNWVKIDFAKFMPLMFGFLHECGRLPTFAEFSQIFLELYTEVVPKDERKTEEFFKPYFIRDFYGWQFEKQNNKRLYHGDTYICDNEVIRFKKELVDNKAVNNLPFNEFTVEVLLQRIFKAFGSCLRDVYNVVRFHERSGRKTFYSLNQDYGGVDLLVDDKYKIACYSWTKAGMKFADIKQEIRHKNLNCTICWVVDVFAEDGVVLISDEVMDYTHEMLTRLDNGEKMELPIIISCSKTFVE